MGVYAIGWASHLMVTLPDIEIVRNGTEWTFQCKTSPGLNEYLVFHISNPLTDNSGYVLRNTTMTTPDTTAHFQLTFPSF